MEALSKEKLEFISSMTSALVWPLVTIGILFYFRKQISPLFGQLKSIKVGGLQAEFKKLSVSNQSLMFLDGIAGKQQWTFYDERRENERDLGPAFIGIINDLLVVEKQELIKKIIVWLSSENKNQTWFASEIIGYYKLSEVEDELSALMPEHTNTELNEYELNCIWAHARITNMTEFSNFLLKTNSNVNQLWALFVYKQMPYTGDHLSVDERISVISSFLNRGDLDQNVKSEASEILIYLKSINA